MYKLTTTVLLATLITSCFAASNSNAAFCSPSSNDVHLKQAIKWYRDSAEQRAIYNEVYTLALNYVDNWVKVHNPKAKSWGIIIDIDETALDNSWYFIKCSDKADDEASFEHYVTIPQKSVALPGVVDFTHRVHALGGYVSMVSNRDGSYKDITGNSLNATVNNLKQQHVYFDQIVLSNYSNSAHPTDKNLRFEAIIHNRYNAKEMIWSNKLPAHKIIAYLGDNIQDFPNLEQKTIVDKASKDQVYKKFGNGFFIFPNPIYGSWESNTYK